MTDKVKAYLENQKAEYRLGKSAEAKYRMEAYTELLGFINTLPEESTQVYVVTRCEEHSDYVEKVFINKQKAEEYCKPFNNDEDSYHRDITEIKITN